MEDEYLEYAEISNTNPDRIKTYRSNQLQGKPWVFENMTPFDIFFVYQPLHISPLGTNLEYVPAKLGTLKKNQTKSFLRDSKGRILEAGGVIIADQPELRDKYVLDPQYKRVRIGTAVYDIGGPGENFFNLYADIAGVHITNHFPFPINIYYQGNLVAWADKYDGLQYLGGSAAVIYFNNNGEGLNFLDILSFHQTDGPFLYKVKLNDTHIQNIHVGVIAPASV